MKILKCRVCGRYFIDLDSLLKHLITHPEVRLRVEPLVKEFYEITF